MLTTISDKVWRLAKSKVFKLNAPDFLPPGGVVVPLLLFESWLLTRDLVYFFDSSLFVINFSFLLLPFILSVLCS